MTLIDCISATFPWITYNFLFPPGLNQRVPLSEEGSKLQKTIDSLAIPMIGHSVPCVVAKNSAIPFQALGFTQYKMGIFIDPEQASKESKDTFNFLIRHELVHIQGNDQLQMSRLRIVSAMVSTAAFSYLFPSLTCSGLEISAAWSLAGLLVPITPVALLGSLFGSVVSCIYLSKRLEKQADIAAFKMCDENEKTAAIDYFRKLQEQQKTMRSESSGISKLFYRALVSPEGNNRIDLAHPSLTQRIQYLTALKESPVMSNKSVK